MRYDKLTLSTKMAVTTGALAGLLVLMAWYSLYALGTINDSFENTANKTTRKVVLIGNLGQSVSDMAAAQRGLLMFAYAKDPALQTAARELFQTSHASVETTLSEMQPLLVTDEGRRALEDIKSRLAQWIPAYQELSRLAEAG